MCMYFWLTSLLDPDLKGIALAALHAVSERSGVEFKRANCSATSTLLNLDCAADGMSFVQHCLALRVHAGRKILQKKTVLVSFNVVLCDLVDRNMYSVFAGL